MKSVLISIQPKWCELIASGKKTIEVRKTRPKLETPFKCYIYCTTKEFLARKANGEFWFAKRNSLIMPNDSIEWSGKVIGEFFFDRIDTIECSSEAHNKFSKESCLTVDEVIDYCNGQDLYGWHISDLKIYDKPKELGEFKKEGFMTEEEWLYALYPNTHCHYLAWAKRFEITRPPQSWGYVEELE